MQVLRLSRRHTLTGTRHEHEASSTPSPIPPLADAFAFSTAGLVSPLMSYLTSNTADETFVYASFSVAAAVVMVLTCDDIFLFPTPLDVRAPLTLPPILILI